MSICRVFEHPDGSVSVTVPAPASRGVVEHPFERTVRVAASLSVEEHNAAIAEQMAAIVGEHPDMEGADFRLEVGAEMVPLPPPVPGPVPEVFLDVTVRVVFLAPEPEDEWLERVWTKTPADQPHLAGLPYHDTDPAA